MKNILLPLLAVLLIVFNTFKVSAQTASGSLVLAIPQNQFNENVDNLGYGFQLHGTIWTPGKKPPFTIGLSGMFLIYGHENDNRPFSITNPDVRVEVDRYYNMASGHILFQVAPFTGTVRPYLEGLFGGAYIYTTTEVDSEYDEREIASSTNFDDFMWNYGGGGGFLFRISGENGSMKALYFDLKARYYLSSKAEYLVEGSVEVDTQNGNVYYSPVESSVDLLTIQLGITAYF